IYIKTKYMAEKKKKNGAEPHPDTEKVKQLEEQLDKCKADIEAKKNDYLRLMAEFDTFRRRSAEERLSLVTSASAETIKGLLPVLDDCEIALTQLEKSSDSDAAKEGTQLIFNKMMAYLKSKGLERIEAKGQDFDTEFHEAVTTFPAPDETQKGKVIDVVQTGYTLGGKVLRYAKVIVGA
ncbi:MAG: nucleotide exchange factor GrpE, partial [Bacteroidales bacterium]|nr:nucleotide exchange factor GrpE [Bacteroidales bacterium]